MDKPSAAACYLLVVCLAMAVNGCGGSSAAPGKQATPRKPLVLRVQVEPIQVRDVVYAIEAVGSLEADDEVQVVARVEGTVESVRFDEGDRVTTNTVLATIDPDRYRLLAAQAVAARERAEADLRRAQADLDRREKLFRTSPPVVSIEDVQHAREEVEQFRAAVAEAEAKQALALLDQERSVVRPLVAGTINRRLIVTGQHVEAKTQLATIVDTRRLRLRFRVSETESVRLVNGREVSFRVAAFPGKTFPARIYHVSRAADPASRMVWVAAWVENPDDRLKPGFFAEVRAEVESHKNALVVPERALLATERGFIVFTVRDKTAREHRVTLGLRTKEGAVEILSGLDRSEAAVVVEGGAVLRDGMPVEVVGGGS